MKNLTYIALMAALIVGCATEPEVKGWPGSYEQIKDDTLRMRLQITHGMEYELFWMSGKTRTDKTNTGAISFTGDTAYFFNKHTITYPGREIIWTCDSTCPMGKEFMLRNDTIFELVFSGARENVLWKPTFRRE